MKYIILSFTVIFGLYISCKSNKQSLDAGTSNSTKSSNETKESTITESEKPMTDYPNNENAKLHEGQYFINQRGDTIKKIVLSEDQWKQKLTPDQFKVLRLKGTESPFTSQLLKNKVEGLYTCQGCGMPLFASKHKFDSGTGWPSFFNVLEKKLINISTDNDLGYPRSELTCAKCGGHLGHVFNDGPKPTGLRYCINGISLDFVKSEN